jgi:hypothetical protein
MKNIAIRTAMWATAGLIVSVAWGIYFATANKAIPIEPATRAVARLTQPTVAFFLSMNAALPLGLTSTVVANTATYALIGLALEMIRRCRSVHLSN